MDGPTTPKDAFVPVSNTSPQSDGPKLIPQQTIRTATEAGATGDRTEPEPNPRQQRKIIGFLTSVDPMPGYFGQKDIPINQSAHDSFMDRLKKGDIKPEKVDKMLGSIATPFDKDPVDQYEVANMASSISRNSQGRAVIAYFTKGDTRERSNLSSADMINFYQSHPLPSRFEQNEAQQFLDELEATNGTNGPQKRAEYEESITEMMRAVYGKRMDYWEQYKLLQKEAEAKPQQPPQEAAAEEPATERGLERMSAESDAEALAFLRERARKNIAARKNKP